MKPPFDLAGGCIQDGYHSFQWLTHQLMYHLGHHSAWTFPRHVNPTQAPGRTWNDSPVSSEKYIITSQQRENDFFHLGLEGIQKLQMRSQPSQLHNWCPLRLCAEDSADWCLHSWQIETEPVRICYCELLMLCDPLQNEGNYQEHLQMKINTHPTTIATGHFASKDRKGHSNAEFQQV